MNNLVSIAGIELNGGHHVPEPISQGLKHAERIASVLHFVFCEGTGEWIDGRSGSILTVAGCAVLKVQFSACFEVVIIRFT